MSVTMKEIARQVGVSQPVVSAVLNNSFKNIRVGSDTREKVLKLAKELKYCPNPIARSLKSSKSGMLNIVVPSAYFFASQHLGNITAGMQDAADAAQFRLNFTLMPPVGYEAVLSGGLVGDGVLLFYWGGVFNEIARAVVDAGYKVLTAYGRCEEAGIHNLYLDNRAGMYELTRQLLHDGRRRIAFLPSHRGDILQQDGEAGIKDAVAEFPGAQMLEFGEGMGPGRGTPLKTLYDNGRDRAVLALESGFDPDVMMFNNDHPALGAVHLLLDRGIDVPGAVAVTGHSNTTAGELGRPALSSVNLRCYDFGQALIARIISMINGDDVPEREAFRVEPVFRETT